MGKREEVVKTIIKKKKDLWIKNDDNDNDIESDDNYLFWHVDYYEKRVRFIQGLRYCTGILIGSCDRQCLMKRKTRIEVTAQVGVMDGRLASHYSPMHRSLARPPLSYS